MIDIIIPVYNQPAMLKACIKSLLKTEPIDYKVWIADDNSPDPAMPLLYASLKLPVIYNQYEQGFPANCDYAVEKTEAPFICLLNSDTTVSPGWLAAMRLDMNDPQVGIVGCKLLYPSRRSVMGGKVQHAGIARNKSGLPYHIFRGYDRYSPDVCVRRELNAVTFACVLIRRECWNDLNGLDRGYELGQFEDVDMCVRARMRAWKIIYEPAAEVFHWEHGSGEEWVEKSSYQNRQRFSRKFPGLGSDEELFAQKRPKRVTPEKQMEMIAWIVHRVRLGALNAMYDEEGRLSREIIQSLRDSVDLPFSDFTEEQKNFAMRYAEQIDDRLHTSGR